MHFAHNFNQTYKKNEMDETEAQIHWKGKRLCNAWIAIEVRESEEKDINLAKRRRESERKVHEKCRRIKVPMMNWRSSSSRRRRRCYCQQWKILVQVFVARAKSPWLPFIDLNLKISHFFLCERTKTNICRIDFPTHSRQCAVPVLFLHFNSLHEPFHFTFSIFFYFLLYSSLMKRNEIYLHSLGNIFH